MSVKKKKKTKISNVQPVEKTDNVADVKAEPQAAIPETTVQKQEVPTETAETPKPSSPSIIDILKSTDPKMLQTAQEWGIPLKPLMEWAIGIESIVKAQSQALETLGVKLTPLINLAERAQQAQAQEQRQVTGNTGGGGGFLNAIIGALSNPEVAKLFGGGSNPLMEKYVDALITRNMNEMVEGTTFDKVMREYFVKKMSKELGEPLMGAKP